MTVESLFGSWTVSSRLEQGAGQRKDRVIVGGSRGEEAPRAAETVQKTVPGQSTHAAPVLRASSGPPPC